ncbi:MAG TPA: acyl-CoA dehydrogenase family protein, partial [Spirochaetota bacterium]|nr:acyl-CoA dehydrogenase family protein [Spirochaetota bacterium]
STASELIFEDCFVPNEWVSMRVQDPGIKNSKKGPYWYTHTLVDFVTSSSRAGVGAIATGIARSSYERTKKYVTDKIANNDRLINHQWVQILLTEMYKNVNIARLTYLESVYTDMLQGLFKLLSKPPVHITVTYLPRFIFTLLSPLLNLPVVTWFFRKYYYDLYTDTERNNSTGWASTAKITCSELGNRNANIALDITGDDGLRHEYGIEKTFRDIKLLEIYESTNQINAMNICHAMVTNDCNDVIYYK